MPILLRTEFHFTGELIDMYIQVQQVPIYLLYGSSDTLCMHAADARAMAAGIADGSSSNQHFTTPDQHLYFGISAHRAISHESVFS